jgi:MOSC domain-containing protein YiiM
MKILSVNVGQPRVVRYEGKPVSAKVYEKPAETAIFKSPITGKVAVGELSLEGDAQVDRRFHGGAMKAVYLYPFEHYAFWRGIFTEMELPFGIFGENLTTTGVSETEFCVGDRFRAGSAEFIVREPRFPCYKLGIRFGRADVVRRFQKSGRCGIYLSVARTGFVEAGDQIEVLMREPHRVSIAEMFAWNENKADSEFARRALEVEALPENWRQKISQSLRACL